MKQRRSDLPFDQIIRRARFDGLNIHLLVADASQHDDRRGASEALGFPQEVEAIVNPEPVIDQVQVMFPPQQLFAARVIGGSPGQIVAFLLDLRKEVARDNEIIPFPPPGHRGCTDTPVPT